MDKRLTTPIINVYPADYPHDPVRIVGNQAGLIALYNQLNDMICNFEEYKEDLFFASDGEGYLLQTEALSIEELDKEPALDMYAKARVEWK